MKAAAALFGILASVPGLYGLGYGITHAVVDHDRAASWNKRGFIGCEGNQLLVANIDFNTVSLRPIQMEDWAKDCNDGIVPGP